MSRAVGASKSVENCEALYRQHQTFLGLPNQPQLEAAFVAMVKDRYKNLEGTADQEEQQDGEPSSGTVSDSKAAALAVNAADNQGDRAAASKGEVGDRVDTVKGVSGFGHQPGETADEAEGLDTESMSNTVSIVSI